MKPGWEPQLVAKTDLRDLGTENGGGRAGSPEDLAGLEGNGEAMRITTLDNAVFVTST